MKKVKIELTKEQAYALTDALDFYSRITLGQLEEIRDLISFDRIPLMDQSIDKYDVTDQVLLKLLEIKRLLGYNDYASYGILNENVPISGRRAYEIKKIVDEQLAIDNDVDSLSVMHDGLKYFRAVPEDPVPVCEITEE